MTVKAYLDKLNSAGGRSLTDSMMETAEIWSNNAARGYFIAAAKDTGLDQDTIGRVLEALTVVFDEISVDEAERKYINY